MSESEILTAITSGVGEITLNRPKALNALTLGMVRQIDPLLADWAEDPEVRVVVIRGAGDRAFCAGGDVRAVAKAGYGSALTRDFFREEYRMNRRIHNYAKPYLALMDGITMGGGVGLSVHGGFRIASEATMVAMPETGIGLFPDVGGSWIMPRLPGEIGMYMSMTGARLNPADCLYAELCDAHVPATSHEALIQALRDGAAPNEAIAVHATDPGPSDLAGQREVIDRCFSAPTVEEMIERLEAEGGKWVEHQRESMAAKSPTSMKLTLRQLRLGAELDFDACMVMEYRMTQAVMAGCDFFEGVRAALVDKDGLPVWNPATLGGVDEALVERHFEPLGAQDLDFPG